jgi:hypothetical protein
MKPRLLTLALLPLGLLLSCHKIHDLPFNPIYRGCDVASCSKNFFSELYPPDFPFLFKKSYDESGTNLKELDFSYWYVQLPNQVRFHYTFVGQRGRTLFLTDTTDRRDTVCWFIFNATGRVASIFARAEVNDGGGGGFDESTQFTYRNDRVYTVVAHRYPPGSTKPYQGFTPDPDTVKYDHFGNCIEALSNPYAYDYTRKATQQFYCDDEMIVFSGVYLAQYLGLFPEITNPVNVRLACHDVIFGVPTPLTGQTFDREGRLTGYMEPAGQQTTITWNCR